MNHLAIPALDLGTDTGLISILIATYAVWQSWAFFRLSKAASEEAERSSRAIRESVTKLESLFDRLYADTFKVMCEMIADMRKHAWHGPPTDQPASAREQVTVSHEAARARREAVAEVSALVERFGASDTQVHQLERAVRRALDQAIDSSLQVERDSAHEVIRGQLTAAIDYERDNRGRTAIRADDLLGPLFERFDPEEVHHALASLRKGGVVNWDGDGDCVEQPDAIIYLAPETLAPQPRRSLMLARASSGRVA
jgi:hypothetical protein